MTEILVALGSLLIGIGSSFWIGRYWFLQGLQLGRDERALDPGPVTGSLEAVAEAAGVLPASTLVRPVGESTGPRHAMPSNLETTDRFASVRPEVRA